MLLLVAGVSVWIWVVRPRQLVEVHDDTGRISVRVPRAWTKEVEGRTPQQWSAYLYLGKFEETPLKVAVYDGRGRLDPLGDRCGVAPVDLAYNAPSSQLRLWVFRNCPEDQLTLVMEKVVEERITVIVEVRTDDERLGRRVLDSVDVKLP